MEITPYYLPSHLYKNAKYALLFSSKVVKKNANYPLLFSTKFSMQPLVLTPYP